MALHRPGLNRSKRYYVIDPEYPNPAVTMKPSYTKFEGKRIQKPSMRMTKKKH